MTGINPIKMRYSNILLWFAEAQNELYGPTAPDATCGLSPIQALAKVHNRAFDTPQDNNSFLLSAMSSKDAMFDAIVKEHAWEFTGEGFRKWELIRWNLLYAKTIDFKEQYLNDLSNEVYQSKVYFNYSNAAKTKIDMSSITWYGIPADKTEADYAGSVSSFGSSKIGTGKDKQVDTNLPSISSGLVGDNVTVKNRYLMPIGSSTISASNGKLHNSYGYSD
jgi:hypothetical protein